MLTRYYVFFFSKMHWRSVRTIDHDNSHSKTCDSIMVCFAFCHTATYKIPCSCFFFFHLTWSHFSKTVTKHRRYLCTCDVANSHEERWHETKYTNALWANLHLWSPLAVCWNSPLKALQWHQSDPPTTLLHAILFILKHHFAEKWIHSTCRQNGLRQALINLKGLPYIPDQPPHCFLPMPVA